MGKCLSSQKVRDLVWGSSSDSIRKKLFLSSFKTHLSCRFCLILRCTTLMDSCDDGFAGPNQGYLILTTDVIVVNEVVPTVVRDFSLTDCPPACWVDLAFSSPWRPSSLPFTFFEKSFSCIFEFFSPSFLVREDPILLSSANAYCYTYREDVSWKRLIDKHSYW